MNVSLHDNEIYTLEKPNAMGQPMSTGTHRGEEKSESRHRTGQVKANQSGLDGGSGQWNGSGQWGRFIEISNLLE